GSAGLQSLLVKCIHILNIEVEHGWHRLVRAMRLAHFKHRTSKPDLGMMNNAIRRLRPEQFFRSEAALEKIDHPLRFPGMQVRSNRAQPCRSVASITVSGDVPEVSAHIAHARFAITIRLIDRFCG